MQVTYEYLKSGYILENGDDISIYDINYRASGGCNHFWLSNCDELNNAKIFTKLDLTNVQKDAWADKFDGHCGGKSNTSFPEFDTLEHLTAFVIDLFEQKYMSDLKKPESIDKTDSSLMFKELIKNVKKKTIAIKL